MRHCIAKRANGAPCKALPLPGLDVCMFHDPAAADRLGEGRREGGRARSRPRTVLAPETARTDIRSVEDVCGLLSDTIHQVRTGQLDGRVANTVGYLASVLVRALEVGELEKRLTELEAVVRHPVR